MIERLDDLQLSAWRNFLTAHAVLINQIDSDLAAADCIPLHWYDVLLELNTAPEKRLRLHELAEKVVLSRSGLTRLIDRLEKEHLLQRQPDPDDRRGLYAVITEDGIAALRKAWPVYAEGIKNRFAAHLSDDEADIFIKAFTRILVSARE